MKHGYFKMGKWAYRVILYSIPHFLCVKSISLPRPWRVPALSIPYMGTIGFNYKENHLKIRLSSSKSEWQIRQRLPKKSGVEDRGLFVKLRTINVYTVQFCFLHVNIFLFAHPPRAPPGDGIGGDQKIAPSPNCVWWRRFESPSQPLYLAKLTRSNMWFWPETSGLLNSDKVQVESVFRALPW